MKNVWINLDGDLVCPDCGTKQFSNRRTRGAKLAMGVSVGVGALAAPKRLQCLGCREYFKSPAVPVPLDTSPTAVQVERPPSGGPRTFGPRLQAGETKVVVTDSEWDGSSAVSMLKAAHPGLTVDAYTRMRGDIARGRCEVAALDAASAELLAGRLRENGFTVIVESDVPDAEPAEQAATTSPPAIDIVDQLSRLADLRDRGVLNEEEFAAQKDKILGA